MKTTMQTRFKEGDAVRSRVDAQGMTKDAVYRVVLVEQLATPFGPFATYVLNGGQVVKNGHLLLDLVPPTTLGMREEREA